MSNRLLPAATAAATPVAACLAVEGVAGGQGSASTGLGHSSDCALVGQGGQASAALPPAAAQGALAPAAPAVAAVVAVAAAAGAAHRLQSFGSTAKLLSFAFPSEMRKESPLGRSSRTSSAASESRATAPATRHGLPAITRA